MFSFFLINIEHIFDIEPSSLPWQQGERWKEEKRTCSDHIFGCDAPFCCLLWWVRDNINEFQSGPLSFSRMSWEVCNACTAMPFRFESRDWARPGYCLCLIRERGGWVGGVKSQRSKLLLLNLTFHICPTPVCIYTPLTTLISRLLSSNNVHIVHPFLTLQVPHQPIFNPSSACLLRRSSCCL